MNRREKIRLIQHCIQNGNASFIIGAGASVTAGIPTATQLVEEINRDHLPRLHSLTEEEKQDYGMVMGCLPNSIQKQVLEPYLENAKVNWGQIALASLMANDVVARVLTFNFDLILEKASSLLGKHFAVYDFAMAPSRQTDQLAQPGIIHLHGQSYGLVTLNSTDATAQHRDNIRPIIEDTIQNSPTIIFGYSGEADSAAEIIMEANDNSCDLFWLDLEPEPPAALQPLFESGHARFFGEMDFDRTMIDLCQALDHWPPLIFSNPPAHLLEELAPVTEYPMEGKSDSSSDILTDTRTRLAKAADEWESDTDLLGKIEKAILEDGSEDDLREFDLDKLTEPEKEMLALLRFIEGNRYFDNGDFKNAVSKYQSSLELKPDDHEALYNWGNALNNLGEHNAACEKFEAALIIKPDDHSTLYNWGIALGDLGEHKAACEKYKAALDIKPDKHEALNNWGNALSHLGEYKAACEKFEAALDIKPDKHEALYNWGLALGKLGEYKTACEKFEAALDIKPDFHEALNNWGNALGKLGEYKTACEKFETAHDIKPDDHEALHNWGVALGLLGEHKAACEKYKAALDIKPDKHEALNNWANALAHLKQYPEAEEKARAAKEISGKAIYNLACALALQGKTDAALDELEECLTDGTLETRDYLEKDTDLDSLRDAPRFIALLEKAG